MTRRTPFTRRTRRALLQTTGAATAGLLTGCLGMFGDDADDEGPGGNGGSGPDVIGYGRGDRGPPGGTPMAEMPPLAGDLHVYSGRSQFLVNELVEALEERYDDLSLTVRYASSTDLVNQIVNEGGGSPADVFYSVNAGALGALADAGRTGTLPTDIQELVREEFRTPDWIGTSGRARSVPYNTEATSADELPTDIMSYPEIDGTLGWAPTYGSAQAFITAMRLLEGESATREWLRGIVEMDAQTYPHELATCQAIADGEIDVGLTNHYYIQRVKAANPGAPIGTHFTTGDAGAMFNVAGAAIVDTASDEDLAANFIRHLLSAEAQDYFARTTFEYPLIPEVEPVGELPTIDQLDVPDIDLTQLSDLETTIDMMREEGIQL